MDVYHLFRLQNVNVEVRILYVQAWDISEKHTWSCENRQLKLESCFICLFLLAFCRLLQNSKTRHVLDPYRKKSWTSWYKVISTFLAESLEIKKLSLKKDAVVRDLVPIEIWFMEAACDKFQKGIREIFLSFQGGLSKIYRIYRKILNSDEGSF